MQLNLSGLPQTFLDVDSMLHKHGGGKCNNWGYKLLIMSKEKWLVGCMDFWVAAAQPRRQCSVRRVLLWMSVCRVSQMTIEL